MNSIVGNGSSLTVDRSCQQEDEKKDEDICVNFILAGDLGGTNTRLALYKAGGRRGGDTNTNAASPNVFHTPLVLEELLNEEYDVDAFGEIGNKLNWSQSRINIHNLVWNVIRPFLNRYFLNMTSPSSWQQQRQHQQLLHELNITITICLAVAGPVDPHKNQGTVLTSQRASYLTGLFGTEIANEFNRVELYCCYYDESRVSLKVESCGVINDFVAQGYGCLSLDRTSHDEVMVLNSGRGSDDAASSPILCVGAGTGFGSCYLTPSATTTTSKATKLTYTCFPSEMGQTEWVPTTSVTVPLPPVLVSKSSTSNRATNDEDDTNGLGVLDLWKYLVHQNEENRVAVEDVVSGVGVTKLYDYYYTSMIQNDNLSNIEHSKVVQKEYSTTTKPTLKGKIIGDNYHHCPICKHVLDTVLLSYGSIVGSCAMSFLPTGGIFITGGLIAHHLDKIGNTNTNTNTNTTAKKRKKVSVDDSNKHDTDNDNLQNDSIFMQAYWSKGRASFLLQDIPVYLVTAKDTGLRGAAVRANMEYEQWTL